MLMLQDDMYIICPNPIKQKILLEQSKEKEIYRVSFATLEQVKQHSFFEVKKEATLYLLEALKENLDVVKTMIQHLYFIEDTPYRHPKLQRLQRIKQQLREEKLITFDDTFISFLKTKKVVMIGYPVLEPYERKMLEELNAIFLPPITHTELSEVIAYPTLYDEVVGLAHEIRILNEQGISYRHIFITGVDETYDYTLQQVFSWFDIPLTLKKKRNILTTIQGKRYLQTRDIEAVTDDEIRMKIVQIETELNYASHSTFYTVLLEDAMRNTYLEEIEYVDSVKVLPEALKVPNILNEDDYLFVLGMNQNKIPSIVKDEDYLSDQAKEEVGLLVSYQKNKAVRNSIQVILTSFFHIQLSLKETSLQALFYPSSLISDLGLQMISPKRYRFCYSHRYNQYLLGELLDDYYKYHQQSENLLYLLPYYHSQYATYQHTFQPFQISFPSLTLSYSHIDDYALCPFRYYAKYVLQLAPYRESFAQKLGTIYHEVLASIYQEDFDFETKFLIATKKVELSAKEMFLLQRLKKELAFIIKTIKEQEQATMLTNAYVEKKLEVKLGENFYVKGFIDKILFYEKDHKTYYAVFDYKTGNVELDLNYINEGLHMQLPIYLYLIENSHLFEQPVFAGFFYQMLLKGSKDEQKKKQDLKLLGVTSDDENILCLLDENYEKSQWIRGLSMTKAGHLSTRSKTLSETKKNQLKGQVETKIKEIGKAIFHGDFRISPKIVNGKNVSCTYCPFQEICFHDVRDNHYIEKVEEEVS